MCKKKGFMDLASAVARRTRRAEMIPFKGTCIKTIYEHIRTPILIEDGLFLTQGATGGYTGHHGLCRRG